MDRFKVTYREETEDEGITPPKPLMVIPEPSDPTGMAIVATPATAVRVAEIADEEAAVADEEAAVAAEEQQMV